MTNTTPYIGLRPYTRDDSALFFGRDGDTQILLDKILANRLTLLFAASGVGKSSLLQAGIMLKLAGAGVLFQQLGRPAADCVKTGDCRGIARAGFITGGA